MTIKDRIIEYLQANPNGVDDDRIARDLRLSHRQQANSRCRDLEKEGLLRRSKVDGKIHNFWVGQSPVSIGRTPHPDTDQKPWHWEGHVQSKVVAELVRRGYEILTVADTARRERGKDIIAMKSERPIWITVKGFPIGTPKTHPSTQAGHWFRQAIFDIVQYREESEAADLGLALPDYPRYRQLARAVTWLIEAARFSYYWVSETGAVTVE